MGALIVFECVAAKHQTDVGSPDKLTIYERQWAFCRAGVQAEGHEWKETGGLDLEALRHHRGQPLVKNAELPAGRT